MPIGMGELSPTLEYEDYSTFESFLTVIRREGERWLHVWSNHYGIIIPNLYISSLHYPTLARYTQPDIIKLSIDYLAAMYLGAEKLGEWMMVFNVIQYVLAHEYAHHVQFHLKPVRYVVSTLLDNIPDRLEVGANITAFRLTGKTHVTKRFEQFRLTGYWE